jgi:hypothetical protein
MTPGAPADPTQAATWHGLHALAEKYPKLVEKMPFMDIFPARVNKKDLWYTDMVGDVSLA